MRKQVVSGNREKVIWIHRAREGRDDAVAFGVAVIGTVTSKRCPIPVRSLVVMGDGRTCEYFVALRAVQSSDLMTADRAPLPHELRARVSDGIINEVRGINRVAYDISSKPPATIEWEWVSGGALERFCNT